MVLSPRYSSVLLCFIIFVISLSGALKFRFSRNRTSLLSEKPTFNVPTLTPNHRRLVPQWSATATSLIKLIAPYGEGQTHGNRQHQWDMGARRELNDPQIWTHIPLVIAALIGLKHRVYDLVLLISIVTPLSLVYHMNFEKPGLLAKTEGTFAKMMFLYGIAQLFNSPIQRLLHIEIPFMIFTTAIFTATNLNKQLYDPWHCWMQIVPSLWAAVIATYHTPLIPIFYY